MNEQVQAQILAATRAIKQHGYKTAAVIKSTVIGGKLSYGFHFEDGKRIGEVIKNDDGSISTVIATVKTTKHLH